VIAYQYKPRMENHTSKEHDRAKLDDSRPIKWLN
jgi:hypothetical protein